MTVYEVPFTPASYAMIVICGWVLSGVLIWFTVSYVANVGPERDGDALFMLLGLLGIVVLPFIYLRRHYVNELAAAKSEGAQRALLAELGALALDEYKARMLWKRHRDRCRLCTPSYVMKCAVYHRVDSEYQSAAEAFDSRASKVVRNEWTPTPPPSITDEAEDEETLR